MHVSYKLKVALKPQTSLISPFYVHHKIPSIFLMKFQIDLAVRTKNQITFHALHQGNALAQ